MNTLKTRTFITAVVAFVFNALDTFGVLVPDKVKQLVNEFLGLGFAFFLRDAIEKNGPIAPSAASNQSEVPDVAPLDLGEQDHVVISDPGQQ